MYRSLVDIQEGAIFIADSHYPNHGDEFWQLLHKIHNGKIKTPQLFLMGDNFDLLIGSLEYSHRDNREMIELINLISINIDIQYFEGNHDFDLKSIFPNINIYSRQNQPQYMMLGDSRVGLSHGDRYAVGLAYEAMTTLIRSPISLWLMRASQRYIIEKMTLHLKSKSICDKIDGFGIKVNNICKYYNSVDMIVEGHFHQGRVVDGIYISLPSLACQKQVGVVIDSAIEFVSVDRL